MERPGAVMFVSSVLFFVDAIMPDVCLSGVDASIPRIPRPSDDEKRPQLVTQEHALMVLCRLYVVSVMPVSRSLACAPCNPFVHRLS